MKMDKEKSKVIEVPEPQVAPMILPPAKEPAKVPQKEREMVPLKRTAK